MKVKILSDTHQKHLDEPQDKVDLLIHCGDSTNYREEYANEKEWRYFWEWWLGYPAEYKVYVPGNHDSFLDSSKGRRFIKEVNKQAYVTGVHILINTTIYIEDLKIFGSPYTTPFGNWCFMQARETIYKKWAHMEESTDIVVTHAPPKGILDIAPSYGRHTGSVELCGDSALLKAVQKIKPQYHFFGHIHDGSAGQNNGLLERNGTIYGNCSQVVDGKFSKGLQHFGKIIEIKSRNNVNNK
jgi:Icc-related predicted phosphoesterase